MVIPFFTDEGIFFTDNFPSIIIIGNFCFPVVNKMIRSQYGIFVD